MTDPWLIALCLILLSFLDNAYGSPRVHIVNRWLRWALVSAMFAAVCITLEWTLKPFFILWLVGFLGWFLVETIYTWVGVRLLSRSGAPLFPVFRENPRADEWPNHPHFIELRNGLRGCGFKKLQSLKADLYEGIQIKSTVFENPEIRVRLQVLFLPSGKRTFSTYYSFASLTEANRLFITDNVQMPFGGYYPENWNVERKPLISSWQKLLERHKNRVAASNEQLTVWNDEPSKDINDRQRDLERYNIDLGILFPSTMHAEHGKITREGRYRLWKEAWLQKYLGVQLQTPSIAH